MQTCHDFYLLCGNVKIPTYLQQSDKEFESFLILYANTIILIGYNLCPAVLYLLFALFA